MTVYVRALRGIELVIVLVRWRNTDVLLYPALPRRLHVCLLRLGLAAVVIAVLVSVGSCAGAPDCLAVKQSRAMLHKINLSICRTAMNWRLHTGRVIHLRAHAAMM